MRHQLCQNEPVPIHIRIDTQEQRSGIPALLAAMPQVHIEMTPLGMGDYDVGGDPRRVFERKTGSDFLSSLAQGRLFAQLAALRKSRFAPILLLEGTRCASVIPRCALKASGGRSATSRLSCACRSCPARGRRIRACLVYAAAKQCQDGHAARGPSRGRRGASLPDRQMQIVLSAAWHRPCHRACSMRALSKPA